MLPSPSQGEAGPQDPWWGEAEGGLSSNWEPRGRSGWLGDGPNYFGGQQVERLRHHVGQGYDTYVDLMLVHDQDPADTVVLHDPAALLQAGVRMNGIDRIGHALACDRMLRMLGAGYRAAGDVPVRDDPHQNPRLLVLDHRNHPAVVLDHQAGHGIQIRVRRTADRMLRHNIFCFHCPILTFFDRPFALPLRLFPARNRSLDTSIVRAARRKNLPGMADSFRRSKNFARGRARTAASLFARRSDG